MVLNKPVGDMYGDKCTGNPLEGECRYECIYCYRNNVKKRSKVMTQKYSGEPRLYNKVMTADWEKEYLKKECQGLFVQSMGDLFGWWVPSDMIEVVLTHAMQFNIQYLFQSKNPERFNKFNQYWINPRLREKITLGTTIETNNYQYQTRRISKAPSPEERSRGLSHLGQEEKNVFHREALLKIPKMVSMEPIMKFDIDELRTFLLLIPRLQYISIGADSGKHGLVEPELEELQALIAEIPASIEVRLKPNLFKKYPELTKEKRV